MLIPVNPIYEDIYMQWILFCHSSAVAAADETECIYFLPQIPPQQYSYSRL